MAAVMLIMLTSLWVLAGSLNKTDGQKNTSCKFCSSGKLVIVWH